MATCNNQIKPVRTYQDTVFRKLFSTKEKLIELYNALEGESFGPETKVELTTLEDVLYIDRKNDLSFLIEDRFVILIEHQSTINPNLPLRDLIYMARTLEKMMESLPIYGEPCKKSPRRSSMCCIRERRNGSRKPCGFRKVLTAARRKIP